MIWVLFLFCLALSFLLSGMEAGVFALSRLRIRQQMRAGRGSARLLHHYLENPENFLWTILVGNTVANFFILGWIVKVLHEAMPQHHIWFALCFGLIVFLFYTFFDLLPKMLFRHLPQSLVHWAGQAISHYSFLPATVGGGGGSGIGLVASFYGWQGFHRAPVWKP